jgi:hypothetical protein
MFRFIGLCFGTLVSLLSADRSLLLENLALRQQLALLKRRHPRPRLDLLDKLFWVAIRKAKYAFFDWHYVQFHFFDQPAADWGASTDIFPKALGSETFRERSVVRIRGNFGDDIDIECRTHLRCGFVGDKQLRRAASDKDNLAQQRTQELDYPFEELNVGARHIPELSV